jgi:hypothetical protein
MPTAYALDRFNLLQIVVDTNRTGFVVRSHLPFLQLGHFVTTAVVMPWLVALFSAVGLLSGCSAILLILSFFACAPSWRSSLGCTGGAGACSPRQASRSGLLRFLRPLGAVVPVVPDRL